MDNDSFNCRFNAPQFYDFNSSMKSDFGDSFFGNEEVIGGTSVDSSLSSARKNMQNKENSPANSASKQRISSVDPSKKPLVDNINLVNVISDKIGDIDLRDKNADSGRVSVSRHVVRVQTANSSSCVQSTVVATTSLPNNLHAIEGYCNDSSPEMSRRADRRPIMASDDQLSDNQSSKKIRQRVISGGDGAPRLYRKPTLPLTPKLKTAMRCIRRNISTAKDEPSSRVAGPVELKNRPKTAKSVTSSSSSVVQEPVIRHAVTSMVRGTPNRITKPNPFSFQKKEEEFLEKKRKMVEEAKKLEQQTLKSNLNFKASAAPRFSPVVVLPRKKSIAPTTCQPFRLITDQRGAAIEKEQKILRDLEEKNRLKRMEFHAQPAAVLKREPFKPQRGHRDAPLDAQPFHLRTEERAGVRQQFDEYLREKEEEKARILEQRRVELELEEQREIKLMRRRQVHKAQPVRRYKDVEPRPLPTITVPVSPKFTTTLRSNKQK